MPRFTESASSVSEYVENSPSQAYIELAEPTLYPKIAFVLPDSSSVAEQSLMSNFNYAFQRQDITNDMIAITRILLCLEVMYYDSRSGPIYILDQYISVSKPREFQQKSSLENKIFTLFDALKKIELYFGESINIDYYFDKIFNFEAYRAKILSQDLGVSPSMERQLWANLGYFESNWKSMNELEVNDFVDNTLHKIISDAHQMNKFINPPVGDKQIIRNLIDDIRFIMEDILKIKTGNSNNFPMGELYPSSRLSSETRFKSWFREILNNFANHMFLQEGDQYFNVITTGRLGDFLKTRPSRAVRFYEVIMSKAVLKWLANSFYGSDINKLNNHVNEIGTSETELHDLLYKPEAFHRTFTGVKFLSDLPHKPNLYMGTRTDKTITLFQLNELTELMSYNIFATSHYEKTLTFNRGRYHDGDGNIYIVPFSINGETMLMIDADDRAGGNAIPYKRKFPDNWFSEINEDATGSFDKLVYGDSIRYLGRFYGTDAIKAIFYETAGVKSLEYLLYKPFNLLGLRAQFHIPAVNQVPNRIMPNSVRNRINNDPGGRLQHLIPKVHIQFNTDGTITEDYGFYAGNQIPPNCKISDWYRDIAYSGNDHIVDQIISEGGSPETFNAMRHRSSWLPTLYETDSKALASAQLLCADKGIYGPFNKYIDFFKQLMLIDWSKDANGNYITDYNHRLGLTEIRARKLVQIYGLVWNSDPVAPIEFLCEQAGQWWEDFENQYIEEEGQENIWARVAFFHLYNHMTGPGGSGQIHLLFNPAQFQEAHPVWTSPQNIATNDWSEWLYPGNPSESLGVMGHFPIHYLTDTITNAQFYNLGRGPQNRLMLILTYLNQVWEKWHPS